MEYIVIVMVIVGLITAIVLIALGLLAAYSSIIARRLDAPSYFDPVLYQGWLSCVCGIWVLFNGALTLIALRHLWEGGANAKLVAAVAALVGPLEVVLGHLLGYIGYALLTKRGEQVRDQAADQAGISSGRVRSVGRLPDALLSLSSGHGRYNWAAFVIRPISPPNGQSAENALHAQIATGRPNSSRSGGSRNGIAWPITMRRRLLRRRARREDRRRARQASEAPPGATVVEHCRSISEVFR
jgi:hypothetical protein